MDSALPRGGTQWAVDRFASQDNGETILEAICQEQAIAVSDGSYEDVLVLLCMSWKVVSLPIS